jgi:transposase
MTRFVQSEDRRQGVLLPEYLDDYVAEDNPVRVIDVFVNELDLGALGCDPRVTSRYRPPAYAVDGSASEPEKPGNGSR